MAWLQVRGAAADTVLALLISVVAGLISSCWLAGKDSFLFGLMVLVVVQTLQNSLKLEAIETGIGRTSAFIGAIVSEDPIAELRLKYSFRRAAILNAHSVHVPKSEVLSFWESCMSRTRSRWIVTTYAAQEETWELGWASQSAKRIQADRIATGCKITRIFVVEDEEEKERLQAIGTEQKALGIEIRWILKSSLLKNYEVRAAYDRLGSIDVALVDDAWIYRTELDDRRRIVSATASRSGDLVGDARFALGEAFQASVA